MRRGAAFWKKEKKRNELVLSISSLEVRRARRAKNKLT